MKTNENQLEFLSRSVDCITDLSIALIRVGLKTITKKQIKELKILAGQLYTYLGSLETITED